MEANPTGNKESRKDHIIPFASLDEAARFLKDFWGAVDPDGVGKRVANHTSENFIGERTHGRDRTILQDVGNGNYTLYVYGNNETNQLSEKAATFLESRS